MPIEGPLKELGIHDVFQLLDLSRKTGVLRVTSQLRRNHGTIYFERGSIVDAEIRSNPHPFGKMLVQSGKITEADLQRARDMQDAGDRRRLGEILVDLGVLTRRDVERQVRFQVEEVVFEIMGWREGYFSFNEGSTAEPRPDTQVRIPTEAVLMEGARRIDEWSRIERQIPHLGVVPALVPPAAGAEGELDLLPPEWELLAAIDGTRDLREIALTLARSEFDVAKTVFGLQSAGVLGITDPSVGRAAGADGEQNLRDALARLEELLRDRALDEARVEAEALAAMHPGEPQANLVLARVHLAAGRGREAEEAVRTTLRLDPSCAPAHRLLGDALATRGRFQEAAEWWGRWLEVLGSSHHGERDQVRTAIEAARALHDVLRSHHGG